MLKLGNYSINNNNNNNSLFLIFNIIRSGSGCIITYLGQLLKSHQVSSHLIATDINSFALQATKLTALNNNVRYFFNQSLINLNYI